MLIISKYDTDKSDLQKKTRDTNKWTTSRLIKKTDYNTKVTEVEWKVPSITGLPTTSALTTVEYEIPDASNLVKKQIIAHKY